MTDDSRLGPEQWQTVSDRAMKHHQQVLAKAHQKARGQERTNFFPELFRLAATQIETDVESFCDRAALVFDEIEAFGQEPDLDDDWLHQITGEKDSFYFSTDSLVTELPSLPGRKRGRKTKPLSEKEVVEAVQLAVQQAEDALSVAHVENPSDWIARIARSLGDNGGLATFATLRQDTGLSPGALFLGLLLGQDNWSLWQAEFYGQVEVQSRT